MRSVLCWFRQFSIGSPNEVMPNPSIKRDALRRSLCQTLGAYAQGNEEWRNLTHHDYNPQHQTQSHAHGQAELSKGATPPYPPADLDVSGDRSISGYNDSMRKVMITRMLPIVIFLIACTVSFPAVVLAQGPTFDCAKASGSIEKMICADPELGALDRTLSAVYSAALSKAANERPPILKVEQRGWIKGRNDCWKADDKRACVVEAYATALSSCRRAIAWFMLHLQFATFATAIRRTR